MKAASSGYTEPSTEQQPETKREAQGTKRRRKRQTSGEAGAKPGLTYMLRLLGEELADAAGADQRADDRLLTR